MILGVGKGGALMVVGVWFLVLLDHKFLGNQTGVNEFDSVLHWLRDFVFCKVVLFFLVEFSM